MRLFRKIIVLLAIFLSGSSSLYAQDYALEVQNDKKIIYVHNLGMPPSTTITQILNMLPELLARPGVNLVNNYSINIDDIGVGDMSDAVLTQLRVVDVEKIEVQESATSSLTNNGEGGSINIVLAKGGDRNVSGNVSLNGGYPTDIMPGVNLVFKPGKWSVRTFFKGEYYDPTKSVTQTDYVPCSDVSPYMYSSYETDTRFIGQTGRIYAENITGKHEVKLTFNECSSTTKSSTITKEQEDKFYTLLGHAFYKYIFTDATNLKVEGEYSYTPKSNIVSSVDTRTTANNISANWELDQRLFKSDNTGWNLILGTTFNHSWNDMPADKETSQNLMPYFKVKGNSGQWSWLAELDYQYFDYSLKNKETNTDIKNYDPHSDLTGMLAASWQFTPNQMLRLVGDRKIQRQNSYTICPIKLNEVSLDYIVDIQNANDVWMINVGGEYIHVADVFRSGDNPYDNSDIWNADAMVCYQRGIFSSSLAANLYNCKRKLETNESEHDTYYNVSFIPTLNFRNNTHLALGIVYNSPVERLSGRKGSCCYTRMTLGKDFGKWNIHLYGTVKIKGRTTDSVYCSLGDSYPTDYIMNTTYDVIRNSIGAGVRYNF